MNRKRFTDATRVTPNITYVGPGSSTGSYSRVSGQFEGMYKEINDVKTVPYKGKFRGVIVLNPLVIEWWSRSVAGSSAITIGAPDWGYRSLTGDYAAWLESRTSSPTASQVDQMVEWFKAQVLCKAYAKMNESPILGGELLGSLDQTIGMLRSPLKKSRDIFQRMLKEKNRRLGKTVRSATLAASNAYLEYRYGLNPLFMDMENAMKAAASWGSQGFLRVARAQMNVDEKVSAVPFSLSGGIPSVDSATGTMLFRDSGRVAAGVIYSVLCEDRMARLNRIMGFRPNDTLQALYELLPYSFVADWFANIGDWLQAVTPAPGITILGNWVTSITTHSYEFPNATLKATVSGLTSYGSTNSSSYTREKVTRAVNVQLPTTPVLTRQNLSTLHSVDACALIAGQIDKLLKGMKH